LLIELNKHLKVVKPEAKAMFPYSYSLLIEDEITAMIDAGAGGKAYAATPAANIQLLFLTHHHFDHINGVSLFNNAQIIAGQEELWAYRDEAQFLISLGSQRWPELMGGTLEEGREQVSRLPNSLPDDIPSRQRFNPIEVNDVLADGNVYKLGQTSLRAIHTPGHSPGHYSFFFPNEEILFTGDLDVSRRGPWYGSETCNLDDLVQSVNKLIDLKPKILVSSHR
jgi:glyoxylase-like metal-dependent hydrolase (beta-lactamase superfamily II)